MTPATAPPEQATSEQKPALEQKIDRLTEALETPEPERVMAAQTRKRLERFQASDQTKGVIAEKHESGKLDHKTREKMNLDNLRAEVDRGHATEADKAILEKAEAEQEAKTAEAAPVAPSPEVSKALEKRTDGKKLWDAVADHPDLVKEFEGADPAKIERLLDATAEELAKGKGGEQAQKEPEFEPQNDEQRVLYRAAKSGQLDQVTETYRRIVHPTTQLGAVRAELIAEFLGKEVSPAHYADVVHAIVSNAQEAEKIETAKNAGVLLDHLRRIAADVRKQAEDKSVEEVKNFYRRFQSNAEPKPKPIPRPPVEVGARGSAPSEEEEYQQAVKSGNFRKFHEIELKREARKRARQ